MLFISNNRRGLFRKGYFIIFIIGIILLLTGHIITAIAGITPEVDYSDLGYDQYLYLMKIYNTLSNLFQNIGIVLFCFATFLGALRDDSLSGDIKRALIISSGLGIIALVLFNITINLYRGWYLFS